MAVRIFLPTSCEYLLEHPLLPKFYHLQRRTLDIFWRQSVSVYSVFYVILTHSEFLTKQDGLLLLLQLKTQVNSVNTLAKIRYKPS